MKKQSWIIVLFMIFGVFVSIDRSGTMVANGPPIAPPQPIFLPTAGNTSVSFNLNTGAAEVTGTGNVSINIENPQLDPIEYKVVEIQPKYITRVVYKDDIIRSTKLINKLMPLSKPANPVWRN